MCRIIGFAGISSQQVTALIRGLLLVEGKSNPHGTGIVVKTPNGNFLQKKGLRSEAFILQGYADFLWQRKYRYALGHVRYKTAGEQSDRNAHPFGVQVRGKWHFGVHNGVIGCATEAAKEFGVKPAAVDSETFWRCVAKLQNQGKDVVTAIEEVTHFISDRGDFAFIYMTDSEIFFWRNEQRPLHVFDLRKLGMGRVLASTKEMFEKAWQMALPEVDIKKVSYFEAKPYRLYRLSATDVVDNKRFEVEPIKDLKHKQRKAEVKKSHFPRTSYSLYTPSWLESYDRSWREQFLFDVPEEEVTEEEVEDFISTLSDDELEMEIVETEIEAAAQNRKELKSYLNALYSEWQERKEGHNGDKKNK